MSQSRTATPNNQQFLDFCMQTLNSCYAIFLYVNASLADIPESTVNIAQTMASMEHIQKLFAAGPFTNIPSVDITPLRDAMIHRTLTKAHTDQLEESIQKLCRAIDVVSNHIETLSGHEVKIDASSSTTSSTAAISERLQPGSTDALIKKAATTYKNTMNHATQEVLLTAVDDKLEKNIMLKTILPALQNIYVGDKNEQEFAKSFEPFGYTGAGKSTLVRMQSFAAGEAKQSRATVLINTQPTLQRSPTHTRNAMSTPPASPKQPDPEPEAEIDPKHHRQNAVDLTPEEAGKISPRQPKR